MGYHVEIDKRSGFCSGVISAITCAEKALETNREVYSLGAIVHNNEELHRLESKGLKVIGRKDLSDLPANTTVLIRAHGEPPSTYKLLRPVILIFWSAPAPWYFSYEKDQTGIRPDQTGQRQDPYLRKERTCRSGRPAGSGGRRCHRSGKLQGSG